MRVEGSQIKYTSVDDLSERIKIVYHETERNAVGDIVDGEEVIRAEVWAKVLPLVGKIDDVTPERLNFITHRITIRYRNDIQPDDEVLWRAKRFVLITPPIDVESRRIWLTFDVQEAIADGKTQETEKTELP